MNVPDILLSGDHRMIEQWRLKEAFKKTLQRRPELLDRERLDAPEIAILEQARAELDAQ
jgi:tRNA (guanine37-N1)-methyltransferase